MEQHFSDIARKAIIKKYFLLVQRYDQLAYDYEHASEDDDELKKAFLQAQTAMYAARNDYITRLPIQPISRCPFSGEQLCYSFDSYGLDGLWWDSKAPARRLLGLPPTFFALDGAAQLGIEVEQFPFLCTPGPDLPFVVPRLLEYVQVKAVLSSFLVGEHRVYLTTYFADPMLYGVNRLNEYGTDSLSYHNADQELVIKSFAPEARDFNLKCYLQNGRLLWIKQNDPQLTLHGTVSDCPYLNLEGSTSNKYIQDGRVWAEEDVTKMTDAEFDADALNRALKFLEAGGHEG